MNQETQAIYEAFDSNNSVMVEAGAGCGKTTLIVNGYRRLPHKTLFLAFNKAIADELSKRISDRLCKTFHAIALQNLSSRLGKLRVDTRKYTNLAKSEGMDYKDAAIVDSIINTFQLYEEPTLLDSSAWTPLFIFNTLSEQEVYELDLPEDKDKEDYFKLASKFLIAEANKPTSLSFSDMLFFLVYFARKRKWHLRDWDCVVIDEAQDVSPIRLAIVRLLSNRIIQVGDRRQAIYAFAGAMTSAMDNIAQAFDCSVYPLSTTWRCSTSVVDEAEKVIGPFLVPRPEAPAGQVGKVTKEQLINSNLDHNSMIVCRTNSPIFKLALELMLAGREFNLQSNLPAKLAKKAKNWAAMSKGIASFKTLVREHYDSKLEKVTSKALKARIEDERQCLLLLADQSVDPSEVEDKLLALMYSKNGVTISTGHKAKGLEAENVFIYDPTLCPAPWVSEEENPEAYEQEINLLYVMITRAKQNLFYVDVEKETK